MTRPDMSIKGKRKLRDMRILGRIARVRSTEQFVWHFLTLSSYINDPPRYEHKREAQASRYANIGQNCESTLYGAIRLAFLTLSSYINAKVISLQPRWACSGVGLWLNGFL